MPFKPPNLTESKAAIGSLQGLGSSTLAAFTEGLKKDFDLMDEPEPGA